MGYNNANNSVNDGLTSISAQTIPNVPVTIQEYSPNGWTAGDYLYNTANGVVIPPSGVTAVGGPITTLQATNQTVIGGLFNANQTLVNPTRTSATYTGPTTTVDNQFGAGSIATGTSRTASCVTLMNGNILYAYFKTSGTTGYYFKIYNTSLNAEVVAETLVATNSTNFGVIAAPMASGNFCIGYWNDSTNTFISRQYTADGVFVNSATTPALGTGPRPRDYSVTYGNYGRAIQLVGGNIVYAYYQTNSTIRIVIVSSTNTYVSTINPNTSVIQNTQGQTFALYPITSNNGFAIAVFSNNNGNSFYAAYNPSGSNLVTANTTVTVYNISILRLLDGSYVGLYSTGGSNLFCAKLNISSLGDISSVTNTVTVTSTWSDNRMVSIIPQSGTGFAVIYNYSTDIRYRRSNNLGTTGSLGSEITFMYTDNNNDGYSVCCGTNGFIYSSSLYALESYYWGTATAAITNGTTYVATSLTPPNYAFLGIAQQTTAAGNVGNVIVNGVATANSNMPSVSGTFYFDSTQTNMFGNKGYVSGRNFVLKGLE